ncbi:hypothetical protein [Ferrimonas balearica]|uniref:hypothetical protein n=1 Tax=Ferrimonas balearica TaxID=44012 RepID=UPI001C9966C6|nr:hypothetical protein [Ferrimonas balearica]MBY5923251.1 hypothetical protein [Ferrimonas balearica]MBY5995209.1 hypothetical protein [Ferrimonas balearica]
MRRTPLVHPKHPMSVLLVALTTAGITFPSLAVVPEADNPIFNNPANTADSCMADAYIETGGKGLKDRVGEVINCTAEDVEIAEVTVKAVDGETSTTGDFTCTLGDTIEVTADLRVRTNAAERYDTTFFVSRDLDSPQVVQQDEEACSILIPKNDFKSTGNAQNLDADECGDIAKSGLVDDEYTLVDAVFTMTCTASPGSEKVEFNYCAAWDVQEDPLNCSATGAAPGQEPSSKSKCNCDIIPLNIFIRPDPPKITKTLKSASNSGTEPMATFEYEVKIERGTTDADLVITDIDDLYRSVADFGSPKVGSSDAPILFDLDGTNSNTTIGNLTLLGADNNCYGKLPVTLTAASPTFTCNFKVKVSDEDLPDALDPDGDTPMPPAGEEEYQNFIRVSSEDLNGDPVGSDTCDVTDDLTSNDVGNCSGIIAVKITNVDPAIAITKTPVAGPGLQNIGGAWFVEDQGLITYEITITNNSTVDALSLLSLTDTSVANLLIDKSGTPACDTYPSSLSANGGKFTCRYIVNVTLANGASYTNTVKVFAKDNENRRTDSMAMITVTRATPKVVLEKKVAKSGDVGIPTPAIGSASFMDSVTIDEPGGSAHPVVYRFTVTNSNSATQEDLTINSLEDDTLFGSVRATAAPVQRSDECAFPQTLSFGTPYVCTLVAYVDGNATDVSDTAYDDTQLVNTAYVKATSTQGKQIQSQPDSATVLFKDVPPTVTGRYGLAGTIFIAVKNTSFEAIKLVELSIFNTPVKDGNFFNGFRIVNDGGTLTGIDDDPTAPVPDVPVACDEPTYSLKLDPGEEYVCAFTVELADFNEGDFAEFQADILRGAPNRNVVVKFVDEEGTPVSTDAQVQVKTGDNIDR